LSPISYSKKRLPRTARQGLPAIAIDLVAVGSGGAVAEAGDAMRDPIEKNLGSSIIPIARVTRLIEAAVINPLRKSFDHSQVITDIDIMMIGEFLLNVLNELQLSPDRI
jgi:hypothetical protein